MLLAVVQHAPSYFVSCRICLIPILHFIQVLYTFSPTFMTEYDFHPSQSGNTSKKLDSDGSTGSPHVLQKSTINVPLTSLPENRSSKAEANQRPDMAEGQHPIWLTIRVANDNPICGEGGNFQIQDQINGTRDDSSKSLPIPSHETSLGCTPSSLSGDASSSNQITLMHPPNPGDVQSVLDRIRILQDMCPASGHHRLALGATPRRDSPSVDIIKAILLHPVPQCGGRFADVYIASSDRTLVALKRLRVFQSDRCQQTILERAIKEALSWCRLKHPYVVPLLGIEIEIFSPFISLVSPWMARGTLVHYISSERPSGIVVNRLLYEVGEGLNYIHSHGVIHGDVCGRNILINDEGHACLADFGLTVFFDAVLGGSALEDCGSLRWMAPELLTPETFQGFTHHRTCASDVYAYACVCVEAYTCELPFPTVLSDFAVAVQVMRGARPKQPSGETGIAMSDGLWVMVDSCFAPQPVNRPNMSTIMSHFL